MSMFDKIAVADGTQLLLGRGGLFIDRKSAAGVNQGSNFVGNATKIEVAPSVETREKRGMVDNTNPLLARSEIARTLEVNISISEYRKEQVALALVGDVQTDYTQAGTAVVGEALSVGATSVKGRTYWTSKRKLTAVTVKDDGVAAANGTDYEFDAETGAVKILSTGTIADGSVVTIDYTPTAIVAGTYSKVTPGSAGPMIGELRFVGKPVNGKTHELLLWRVQFNPTGVLALLSDDFVDFDLRGTILDDSVNHPAPDNFGRLLQY